MKINRSYFLFFGLLLIIAYVIVKDKNNKAADKTQKSIPQESPKNEYSPPPLIAKEVVLQKEPFLPEVETIVSGKTAIDELQDDLLTRKIFNHSAQIQKKHEELLYKILHDKNKEDLFDDYLNLKKERAKNISEQLKKDNSQRAVFLFNFNYHERLHKIFGDEIYQEYLKSLKTVNEEAQKAKIVLEF